VFASWPKARRSAAKRTMAIKITLARSPITGCRLRPIRLFNRIYGETIDEVSEISPRCWKGDANIEAVDLSTPFNFPMVSSLCDPP
jgi:hypothetical protein